MRSCFERVMKGNGRKITGLMIGIVPVTAPATPRSTCARARLVSFAIIA